MFEDKQLSRRFKSTRRRGTSLLEVMIATVCASMLLVPTATMLGEAGRWSDRMEQQSELVSLANGCIAEVEFQLASNFQRGQLQNTFASQGFPNSRYTTTYSDRVADGGIPNRFMVIQVTTWVDQNRNAILDTGEPRHQLVTGVARRG
jgi:Tfp pilus assembly protein PilV